MPRFVTHEALASGLLNKGHCSASGCLLPWKASLTNNENLLLLVMTRMEKDFTSLAVKSRKPWSQKDLETRLQ